MGDPNTKSQPNGIDTAESTIEIAANTVADTKWAGRKFLSYFGKSLKLISKRVPLIGAAVTSVFVAKETIGYLAKGQFSEAGASVLCGAAEIAGNIVGFGTQRSKTAIFHTNFRTLAVLVINKARASCGQHSKNTNKL